MTSSRQIGTPAAVSLLLLLLPVVALAQEPAACLSSDPSAWPQAAKPYFLIIADTSGSMEMDPGTLGCAGYPATKTGHLACGLKYALLANDGAAQFGLMTFASYMYGCVGSVCATASCQFACFDEEMNSTGLCDGCGAEFQPLANSAGREGGNLVVPLPAQGSAANSSALLSWVDAQCTSSKELYATGKSPINGALRDAYRYLSGAWTSPVTGSAYPTPLATTGEAACRRLNVILLADGDENCDLPADAVDAASDLQTGFVLGGITWKVKVYVVDIGNGMGPLADQIANAGGTGFAYDAYYGAEIGRILSTIILGEASGLEVCDNQDNNCNGCTDEGFQHFGNVQSVSTNCCAWSTTAQRTTCFSTFQASITASKPQGDPKLLPCTTAAQAASPATWLCFNPGEVCDGTDNNLDGTIDEGKTKCGIPSACPSPEKCDGIDNDCDGAIDEGSCGSCIYSAEICDGCDNDCDGSVDEGLASIPCGLAFPANCAGTHVCKKQPGTVPPGSCVPNQGWGACLNSPAAETCDGLDNDCDGSVDEGAPAASCVPSGTSPTLVYWAKGQCKRGMLECGTTTCNGFVGPGTEVCDGVDNDCDGTVDESTFGVGMPCGVNFPPCSPGTTACVNGALVCQGGVAPADEICDGIDNNCNGIVDDGPLFDAPPGNGGCWELPGNCCNWGGATWCPPPGATCTGLGGLVAPCLAGRLECAGAQGYRCQGPKGPTPETCNGLDDDCNGINDDGPLSSSGYPCGLTQGTCSQGQTDCVAGAVVCKQDSVPVPEVCDGEDNDCDGLVDDEILPTSTCAPPYDTALFPGERASGLCAYGHLLCNGEGGQQCVGGVGPAPEVCDGMDNDCDGQVDESGQAPDGVDGTYAPESMVQLGEPCGSQIGECLGAVWLCAYGTPECSKVAREEQCDGMDNDCDGVVDEAPVPGQAPLCAPGTLCVRHADVVRCSQPCRSEKPLCPAAQECVEVVESSAGGALPDGCLPSDLLAIPQPLVALDLGQERVPPLSAPKPPAALLGRAVEAVRTPAANRITNPPSSAAGEPERVEEYEALNEPTETSLEPQTNADGADFGSEERARDQESAGSQGGCSASLAGEAQAPAVALLLALLTFALASARWRRMTAALTLTLMFVGALGCSTSDSGKTKEDLATQDSGHDGPLPDVVAPDTTKPDDTIGQDSVADLLDTTSDLASDETSPDSNSNDTTTPDGTADAGCPDADLHSLETCGACDHNCLDDIPPNSDADTAICDWSGNPDEPGVCRFLGCLGGWADADPGIPGCEYFCTKSGLPETVCDGKDDDCDGVADEDVDLCTPQNCGACGNECSGGNAVWDCVSQGAMCKDASCIIKSCLEGFVDKDKLPGTGCEAPCDKVSDIEEFCDGLDDDCNGLVDEVFSFDSPAFCGSCDQNCYALFPHADIESVSCAWNGVVGAAGVCGFDVCAGNYWDLAPDAVGCETYCVQTDVEDDDCDLRDDDCDGAVDDDSNLCTLDNCGVCGFACLAGPHVVAVACQDEMGLGCAHATCAVTACDTGYHDLDKRHQNGCEFACTPTGEELCNGIDEDCDGEVDEDTSHACFGDALGECAAPAHAGQTVCVAGESFCQGSELLRKGFLRETCNGLDDDCNGVVDDAPSDVGAACGTSDVAPCSLGAYHCQNGTLKCLGASDPQVETCNGLDDDCDGQVDLSLGQAPTDSVGLCNVPMPPPAGATSPCVAGSKQCIGGLVSCVGSAGPTGTTDTCGVDANCDGMLTSQPATSSSVLHCGACNNACANDGPNQVWSCQNGICLNGGCKSGWYDIDGDSMCEYGCVKLQSVEECNDIDDDCNGIIDDVVVLPSAAAVCGTSPLATASECLSPAVSVACVAGNWVCNFPQGVCSPTCALAAEVCDNLDNDCDGALNENVAGFGTLCASDDGLAAPGHGACRTVGTRVCAGPDATACSATKLPCEMAPGGCTELCDGVDNDCDGSVDEPFSSKGANAAYFVKPAVTRVSATTWIFSYEASRANATGTSSGWGNGYYTSAPAGTTLDQTRACSMPGRMPWHSVTADEAIQVCTAMGGALCTSSQWTLACSTTNNPVCRWGYNPRGASCSQAHTSTKFCNLGSTFDSNPNQAGDQDGMLPTASSSLQNCWADWSNLQGNTQSTNKIFDMTGNLAELTLSSPGIYPVVGGSYVTVTTDGAECSFTEAWLDGQDASAYYGFRCCFTSDPTL